MKRFNSLSTISTFVVLAAGTAFAGGPTPIAQDAPVYAAAPVTYGYDWTGGYVGAALSFHEAELSSGSGSVSDDDTGLGIFAGYNYDMGQYVIGAELSYDRAGTDGLDIDLTRLKGRVGYDAGKWLPYATVGFAHVKADDGTTSLSDSGVSFGLGVDYAVSRNFVLGAELTRSSFNDFDSTGVDLDIDTIQIRGSWKF